MNYKVNFTRKAEKQFDKLDKSVRKQISTKAKDYDTWMDYYNRHDPEGKHVPVSNIMIRGWIQSDIDKINHLKKLYNNYNKVSYAKIDSITSVSKLKISKPINDLDPIGRIRVSEEVMNVIDRAIAKKLLAGPWQRIDKKTE